MKTFRSAAFSERFAKVLFFGAASILTSVMTPNCLGQIFKATNDQTVPVPGVGHDYVVGLNEIVSPSNGSLSVRISVPTPPGRKLNLPFQFSYNSNGVIQVDGLNASLSVTSNLDRNFAEQGGWSYGLPWLSAISLNLPSRNPSYPDEKCAVDTGFVFTAPDGSRHPLGLGLTVSTTECNQLDVFPTTAYTGGDFFYQASTTNGASDFLTAPFDVWDKDGTVFHFNSVKGGTGNCISFCDVPNFIEDRNGNVINISSTGTSGFPLTVTDTAGRPSLSISGFGSSAGDTVSVSGQSNTYKVNWGTTPYNYSIPATAVTATNSDPNCGSTTNSPGANGSMPVVSSIELPDSTSYYFGYDPVSGLLNKITYPTGAYVSYTWGPSQLPSDLAGYEDSYFNPDACSAEYNAFVVLSRTVFDGVSTTETQTFDYSTTWPTSQPVNWTAKTTTVTTTDMTPAAQPTIKTVYSYSPFPAFNPPNYTNIVAGYIPLENQITDEDANGNVFRTVTKVWAPNYSDLLQSEATALGSGSSASTSKVSYSFGNYSLWTNIIEQDETAYGSGAPGPVLRKTLINYAPFAPNTFGALPADRPCQVQITDGSGTVSAETDTYYDGGTTLCGADGTQAVSAVNGLPSGTHDETNYGVNAPSRGNATTVSRKCLLNCTTSVSTTTATYDETGQVISTTDPCGTATCGDMTGTGHMTTYSYADSPSGGNTYGNSNAYVTQITRPATASTHIEYFQYNYPSGQLSQSTDENSQVTNYSYTDPLLRLTDVYGPPNASAHTHIDPEPGTNPTVTTTDPAGVITKTIYDGLYRVKQTQVMSDTPPDLVDTTYNGMGQVYTVSNPYRSANDLTYGVTTTTYDPLGRKKTQLQPDKTSSLGWNYTGNVTTATDEILNQWQRTTDGLGHLTQVLEPSVSSKTATVETDYSYDVLDNLLGVTQKGVSGEIPVTRSFVYDSLSRLTSVTNPEVCGPASVGNCPPTAYTYDANGNLLSKVDPRGASGGGVWYCYDVLNRVVGKAYTQRTCPLSSPDVAYAYDVSSITGNANTKGHLTSESTFVNGTMWTQRQPYSYYGAGQIMAEQQCTPGSNCSATQNTLQYTYDLAGKMTGSTNGISNPAVSLGYGYDLAGRLQSVTTNSFPANDPQHPPTLFSAVAATSATCGSSAALPAYDAANQLQNALIAISATQQAAIVRSRCYDNRLRPTSETDSTQDSVPGVAASTTVTVSGTEQSIGGSGTSTPATGTITLSYHSGAQVMRPIPLFVGSSITLPDGYRASFVAPSNSAVGVANALAAVLNATSSPVTAVVASGGTASSASVTLTTKTTGADQNGAIKLTLVSQVTAAPASLAGGAGTTYDTGTVTANVNGTAVTTSYGQSSTAQTVAAALATAISGSGAGVTATPGTSGTITVTATQTGTAANGWTVTLSSATDEPNFFSSASFSGTSGTLSGGVAGSSPGPFYQYTIPAPGAPAGYDPHGNLLSYSDCLNDNCVNNSCPNNTCVMGSWGMTYDNLNRVQGVSASFGRWNSLTLGWVYDSFGNRKTQTQGGSPNAPAPQTEALLPTNNNQIGASGYGYDVAGNPTSDPSNQYAYDTEGRLCAVHNVTLQSSTGYVYDAEGRRVAKGRIQPQLPLTQAACNGPNNSYAQTESYLLGLSGEQTTELDSTGSFLRSHVYANGGLFATYTAGTPVFPNGTTEFAFGDWLGTKRVVASPNGAVVGTCTSMPFGDYLGCTGTPMSGHHFTGQIHDQESLNDYFGARYYGEYTGRFMSPDWGADVFALPFADLKNPQTLNLYSYVRNNPLSRTDPDGHNVLVCVDGATSCLNYTDQGYQNLLTAQNGQQGINLPTGSMPNGDITCGGQTCGTANFFEPGAQDETGDELMGVAGAVAGSGIVRSMFNAITGLAGSGNSVTTTVVNTGARAARLRQLFGTEGPGGLQGSPEQAARQALQQLQATKELPDGLSQSDLDFYKGVMEKAANSPNNPNQAVQSIRGEILNLAERILGGGK